MARCRAPLPFTRAWPRRSTRTSSATGCTSQVDGDVWRIVEFQHVKPGKGGAFVRTKLKGLDTGAVVDKTFRAGERFARVHTEVKTVQYLYDDGSEAHFMDQETYDQFGLPHAAGRGRASRSSRPRARCRCSPWTASRRASRCPPRSS